MPCVTSRKCPAKRNLNHTPVKSNTIIITRDALRAARVKKRVGYLCRLVFIFLRRGHKW